MKRPTPVGRHTPVARLVARAYELVSRRWFVNVALGAAALLSMIAVCCGVGALSAPWFMAELLAVQLAEVHGQRLVRNKGWLAATGVLLAAVLLVAASAWLTTLAFETQVAESSATDPVFATLPQYSGALIAALTTIAALAAVIPLFYAPVILLARGGNVGGALLESVRLVIDGGFVRHLHISLVSHTIQLSPLLLAAGIAVLVAGPSALPAALLIGSPLLFVTLPLGQAMFVAAYDDVRDTITDPRRTRFVARPPRSLIVAMLFVVLTPIASLFAFGASLVRPSHLAEGVADRGELLTEVDPTQRAQTHLYLPQTTLDLQVTRQRVRVVAGDGGGAGTLPLRSQAAIDRVIVRRTGTIFLIQIDQGAHHWLTRVDGAGVRLDDDLRARLSDRAPLWAITLMLGTLLLALTLLGPPVYQLALVRRLYTLPSDARPEAAQIHQRREQAIVRGWGACAAMLPALTATLVWTLRAVAGL